MKWLSPLCLFLVVAFSVTAQTTPNGWKYDILYSGQGPYLNANQGALTHNQLVDEQGNILVSTYIIGVPDYQLISELSTAFQQAFSVMQEGGKYRFHISVEDFKAAIKSAKAPNIPGNMLSWEMELLKILPPLPDGARLIKQTLDSKGVDAAYQDYQTFLNEQQAYFGEWETNQIGYFFMKHGAVDKAVKVFAYNAKQHPKSANAHDSLAEAYYQAGEHQKAKNHYQQSLAINPDNKNAQKMLDKL